MFWSIDHCKLFELLEHCWRQDHFFLPFAWPLNQNPHLIITMNYGSKNCQAVQSYEMVCLKAWMKPDYMVLTTDYGHSERAFFQKLETFELGQTNWAEILGGILAISSQTIGIILALWFPCSWESVAGSFSYKKSWFLGLKHTTPKYSQNKILAVKNLEKSLRSSVFGVHN